MATLFNTKIKDTYQSLLKLEDNTILTTTTKNVTDGLGNASPLYMSTTRVGIGTNNPTGVLHVVSAEVMGGNNGGQIVLSQSGASSAVVGIQGSGWNTFGIWGISRFTTTSVPDLRIFASGIVSVYNNSLLVGAITTSTAKFHVRGGGSSSATTALIVDNSSGIEAFKVTDDRTTTISGTQTNLSTTNVYVGALSLTSAGVGATGQGIWSTGTDGQMVLAGSLGGFVIKGWAGYTVSLINNSNPRNLFSIQQYGFSDGNTNGLTGNTLNIAPIYNFVGTSTSNTVRGIYYNPTLTSLVSTTHIAIETVTGNVLLGTTSGNVGIGTSSPTNKLSIKQVDSNTSILRLDSASSVGSNTYEVGVDFYSRITGAGGTDSYPVGKIYGTGGSEFRSGKLRFQTIITNGGSLTDTMTLYQGNVGIGSLNTLPSTLLQVTGLKDTVVADFSSNTVGVNEGVSIQLSAAAGSYPLGVIKGIFTANSGYSALTFSTSTLNTPTEAMRITSGQNVLIGTTTDSGYKLDVNGTTRVSGGIFQSMGTSSLNLLTAGTTAQTSDRGIFIGNGSFNNASIVGIALGNNLTLGTGTGNVVIGFTASASGGSIAISRGGQGASASGGGLAIGGTSTGGIAIGGTTNTNGAIAIGSSSTATATNSVAIGQIVSATGIFSTAVGDRASASHTQSIAIGLGSKTSATGDFVAGGYFPNGGYGIYNVYFGTGPQGDQVNEINGDSYAINGSGGFGTNKNGGNLTLAGGKGTGTGTPGNLIFATATTTTTGSTLQSLTERMRINGSGNVMINTTTDNGYKFNVNGTAFVSELITTGGMVKHNPYTVGVRALEIYSGIGHAGNTGVWASMYQVGVYGNGWDSYYGTQGYGVIGDPNNTSDGGSVVNIGVYGGASLSNATGVRGTSGLFGKATNFRNASAALEVNSTTHGFLPPRMTAAQRSALTTITGFGTITGGSGYVDGTYRTVSLTGGSGQNAYAIITVSGGSVTGVSLESVNLGGLSGGFGYTNGASVSASNTQLGGSGAGFSVIINASTPVGMMVYQTDATEGLYIYKSTGWTFIA